VHIGTGEQAFDASSSVILNGRIGAFDLNSYLSDHREEVDRYVEMVNGDWKGSFLQYFVPDEVREDPRYLIYSVAVDDQVCKRLNNDIKDGKRFSIPEHIKTGLGEAYIPGSSLKGAIRTALAHLALKEKSELWGRINSATNYNKRGEMLEKVLFECGPMNDLKRNLNHDLMRCIEVSDTNSVRPDDVLKVYEIRVVQRNNNRLLIPTRLRAPMTYETLNEGVSFTFTIKVNSRLLSEIWNRRDLKEWRGADEKIPLLFGCRPDEIAKEELEKQVINRIFQACRSKSLSVIEYEKRFLEGISGNKVHAGCLGPLDQDYRNRTKYYCRACGRGGIPTAEVTNLNEVAAFNEKLGSILNKNKNIAFTRLGWGTGFLVKTVNETFKEGTSGDKGRTSEPKTRRVLMNNGKPMGALGWVILERAENQVYH